jgi:uncharacterized protein (DUF2235 family)
MGMGEGSEKPLDEATLSGGTGAGGESGHSGDSARGKAIVLFSDGTGNSSAKLFKTNVWRMYEAVDLGPPEKGQRKQIAFYDDGVGTSGFKPLAMLGGVFGVGLRRNVLDIYRYACRNYEKGPTQQAGDERGEGGDEIYGFGFSRGAFTMRVAIAMIAKVGLVVTEDEAELDRRAKQAWRAYRSFAPRRSWAPVNLWLRLRHRGRYDEVRAAALERERARNLHPIIRFVGVWDTVAAYGGPVTEIIEAIDNWVVRLSMPNYKLADSVRRARHALSIDDERDAFHPLLWDELHEEEMIRKADPRTPWIDRKRLEQVWFTGMHADVGGGYPNESLSYVSFLWMMEEAEEAGLRAVPVMLERFHALASSAGPIHDSRSGVGSYYRYQPRKIATWMEPIEPSLLARRHPDLERGLIRSVKLHESVAARIASGTDRYAPITLPAAIDVVPPQRRGENAPPPEKDEKDGRRRRSPLPLISKELRERFEHPLWNADRVERMRPVWSLVHRRRFSYFISLFLTLALFLMPVWEGWFGAPPLLASGHGVAGRLIALLGAFLPGFLVAIVESWANNPFYVLLLAAALLLSNGYASRVERRLRDTTRAIWDRMVDLDQSEAPEVAEAPRDRREPKLLRLLRWRVVPFFIFIALLAVALWLILAVTTRIALGFHERGQALCASSRPAPAEETASTFLFDTRTPCHAAGLRVERDRRYVVEMIVIEPWRDASYATDPRGVSAAQMGLRGYVAVPLRRAVGANYLQPVAHIRSGGAGPSIQPLQLKRGPQNNAWRGEFVARRSGELSLFANDAMLPFPAFGRAITTFYTDTGGGNHGRAVVRVTWSDSIGSR